MKLNLGCGTDIRDGYVNVDFRPIPGVDRVVDLSVFPWPFEDESADEILLLDFLEHFPYAVTQHLLLECFRVLSSGGRLVVQVPDAVHTMRALSQEGDYLCNRCGGRMQRNVSATKGGDPPVNVSECPDCGQSADSISEAAVGRFYGGQDYPGNFHQTAFTKRSLRAKAKEAGLVDVTALSSAERDHYWRNWTLHMTFERGDLW